MLEDGLAGECKGFSSVVNCMLGDGIGIMFWQQKWVGNVTLREALPNVYNVSLPCAKARTIFSQGVWVEDRRVWKLLLKECLSVDAVEEMALLLSVL